MDRTNPLITAIVPVYNTEPYLERCVRSVLASREPDWELLLIDDGSTDGSADLCRRLAREDPRIRFFSQKNRGVSAARNRALAEARGTWTVFIDSDDGITPDFFAEIRANGRDTDWILFRTGVMGRIPARPKEPEARRTAVDRAETRDLVRCCLRMSRHPVCGNLNFRSPCAKAYRTDLLRKANITFPEQVDLGEDELFNLAYINLVGSYVFCDLVVYEIFLRGNSLSHKFRPNLLEEDRAFRQRIRERLAEIYSDLDLTDVYHDDVLAACAYILQNSVFSPANPASRREKRQACRVLKKTEPYRRALAENRRLGSRKRRLFLGCFKLGLYGIVEKICTLKD